MKKETFLKLVHTLTSVDESYESLFKLGIDIIDHPLLNEINNTIYDVIKDTYGEGGLDWVEWWTYEKLSNPELKAFVPNENGEDIEIRTIDDLYNYLEQNCIQI